jgi:hypothetical protein
MNLLSFYLEFYFSTGFRFCPCGTSITLSNLSYFYAKPKSGIVSKIIKFQPPFLTGFFTTGKQFKTLNTVEVPSLCSDAPQPKTSGRKWFYYYVDHINGKTQNTKEMQHLCYSGTTLVFKRNINAEIHTFVFLNPS